MSSGNRVLVATRGACASCKASDITLKHFVESKLRDLVSPELVIEEVVHEKQFIWTIMQPRKVAAEVLEAMLPYFRDLYGNPSSMHSFGGQVAQEIHEARKQVASLIGAIPEEIIFTSCGTESDNAAIRSALAVHPDRVILSPAAWNIRH